MSNFLKVACREMFRETFEGVKPGERYTWYVQGKEAILPSILKLNSDQASCPFPGARATIGAHVNHLCYYLHLFNVERRGETEKRDWEGSWKVQTFDDAAWKDVCDRTKREYDEAYAWYISEAGSEDDLPSEDAAIGTIANIAHAAFHLGAIRALIPIVQ